MVKFDVSLGFMRSDSYQCSSGCREEDAYSQWMLTQKIKLVTDDIFSEFCDFSVGWESTRAPAIWGTMGVPIKFMRMALKVLEQKLWEHAVDTARSQASGQPMTTDASYVNYEKRYEQGKTIDDFKNDALESMTPICAPKTKRGQAEICELATSKDECISKDPPFDGKCQWKLPDKSFLETADDDNDSADESSLQQDAAETNGNEEEEEDEEQRQEEHQEDFSSDKQISLSDLQMGFKSRESLRQNFALLRSQLGAGFLEIATINLIIQWIIWFDVTLTVAAVMTAVAKMVKEISKKLIMSAVTGALDKAAASAMGGSACPPRGSPFYDKKPTWMDRAFVR